MRAMRSRQQAAQPPARQAGFTRVVIEEDESDEEPATSSPAGHNGARPNPAATSVSRAGFTRVEVEEADDSEDEPVARQPPGACAPSAASLGLGPAADPAPQVATAVLMVP